MIIILGTAAKGGIDGVIKDHIACGLYNKVGYQRITTHRGLSKLDDLFLCFSSFFYFIKTVFFNNVSLVHAHMSYNGSFWRKLFFLMMTKLLRKKFICHLHGSEFKSYVGKSGALRSKLLKFLIRRSDGFFVLSDGWAEFVKEFSGIDATVINNFVDVPKKYLGNKNKKVEIVFIGAFIQRKGILDLVEAYALSGSKNKLHLCGDGPLKRNVEKRIIELNLTETVFLHGWVDFDTKMELLASSQIFVLPTYNEGLPLTIIEAFAAGSTVISTPVGAIPEVVKHNYSGVLFEPGDINGLSDAIKVLIKDVELAKLNASNAYEIYSQNFTSSVVVPKIKAAYKNIGVEL